MDSPTVTVRTEVDGTRVLVCSGEFDLDTVATVTAACEQEAAHQQVLVVDVARLGFADSSFLNVLVTLRKRRPVVLVGPLPLQLQRLLELTGALALFEVREPSS
ncbi:STAS domain-containing protein [Streptomyces sp. NPDC048387]|uniref:STAS domain-containing protein n=1 Tax=Streptomyces sp. NPDC048387 TaxID=3365542 RepID=UPI00371A0866